MFAGIVEETATVLSVEEGEESRRITVISVLDHADTNIGDSIALDGVCLTVVEIAQQNDTYHLSFDVSSETLRCTTLGTLTNDAPLHLERSLQIGGRLHGHFVTGHVDGLVTLVHREEEGETVKLTFQLEDGGDGLRFIAAKGSVSLSGVSLTVGEVDKNGFSVYIIPHTSSVTRLGDLSIRDQINIEFDILARYVAEKHYV